MGKRGPKPGMGGRPRKPISEKILNGNPGGHKMTVLDFKDSAADLEGVSMPKPSEYLSAKQKNGTEFFAVEVYEIVWNWLKERGCEFRIISRSTQMCLCLIVPICSITMLPANTVRTIQP